MLRKLYDWTLDQASRPRAEYTLFGISFTESSFFPIPPDVLLAPMVIARPERAWWLAFLCTVASVLGAIAGWVIGYAAWETIALPILGFYGFDDPRAIIQPFVDEWGAWVTFAAAVTPLPYKLATIGAGAMVLNLPIFILASILGRGLRFFIVAGLLKYAGPPIRDFVEKRLGLAFTVGVVCLVGGFVVVKVMLAPG